MVSAAQPSSSIAVLLADVDGTVVTKDKVITARTVDAVKRMREAGIIFTVTSGCPPRGLRMLVEPLGLTMPMAAFTGGVIVLPDLSVLDERTLPDYLLPGLVETMESHGLDVWLYSATEWYVRSRQAPRVDREASTVQCEPTVVPSFDTVLSGIVKVVGVSDDHPRVVACEALLQQEYGTQVSAARSQPYSLDVTNPTANKGTVIERLSRYLQVPLEQIATIGDRLNDVMMFRPSGLSIAMGNASEDVQRQAMCVTTSFADEGFANAVDKFILPRATPATGAATKATGQLNRLGQSLWLDNITRDRQQGLVRRSQVRGAAKEPGDVLRQRVQDLARGVAAGHARRVGRKDGKVAVPLLRQLAALHLVDLGCELRVRGPVGGEPLHPLLPGRGAAPPNASVEVLGDALGDQELRVLGPAVIALDDPDFGIAERLAVGLGRVLLARRAVADVTVEDDDRGPALRTPDDADGVLDPVDVVGVADPLDVPAVAQEARRHILGEGDARVV